LDELQSGDPQRIGPYRLEGRLGSGGMGRVYLGRSPGGRRVAVKTIRAELAGNAEFRARFAREVSAARKVSGIFTAAVVDANLDEPVPWLATSFVPGPSLAEAVTAGGPLSADSMLRLAAGLAEGLKAIHAAGVVHRDLKPSNVILAEDGPRILDFGISRSAGLSALTQTGMVVGSPGFMSPEQAEGREVGPPGDIFSLGGVLAFAATGEEPFGGGSTAALLYRVVHGEPDTGGLPGELRPLIERCLAKDPQQRPTAAQLLAEVSAAQPGTHPLPEPAIGGPPRHGPAGAAPDETAEAMTWPTRPAAERAAARDVRLRSEPPPAASSEPTASTPPVMPGGGEEAALDSAVASGHSHPSGHPRPWVPDSPGSVGPRGKHGWLSRKVISGALAIGVLALSGTMTALLLTSRSSPATVTLQPAGAPSPDPFTPSAGADQPGVRRLPGSGGTVSGGTPGLYGGTRSKASCNPQQMVSFLRANPDKAAAWSTVLGIRPADISAYVAGLTPAVLRSDTAVTNHGYDHGHVTRIPAILEAGTAVLVDRYGQPVTKCFCGNPLTRPTDNTGATYTGKRWPSFSSASVTYIQRTTAPVKSFTLANTAGSGSFRRPTGSSGSADQPTTLTGTPPPSTSGPPSAPSTSGPPSAPSTSGPPSAPSTSGPPSRPAPAPTSAGLPATP